MQPRNDFRREKLPTYMAPSDDWGPICARSAWGEMPNRTLILALERGQRLKLQAAFRRYVVLLSHYIAAGMGGISWVVVQNIS